MYFQLPPLLIMAKKKLTKPKGLYFKHLWHLCWKFPQVLYSKLYDFKSYPVLNYLNYSRTYVLHLFHFQVFRFVYPEVRDVFNRYKYSVGWPSAGCHQGPLPTEQDRVASQISFLMRWRCSSLIFTFSNATNAWFTSVLGSN